MSEDLFGNPIEDKPAEKKAKAVNNLEIVQTVIERACSERPYMLIGLTGQPHRMGDNGLAKPLIFWEAEALHQLIRQKLLTVGGNHTYETRYGAKTGQAVLVPRKTRDMLNRWRALKPLHGNTTTTKRSA
jgi:hypothetical protein